MPVITPALKALVVRTISSWNSIKKYSRTLVSNPEKDSRSKYNAKEGLSEIEIPRGTISGLRTFIRRLNRTRAQDTHASDLYAGGTLKSVDEDYHGQLRAIHRDDTDHLVSKIPVGPGNAV